MKRSEPWRFPVAVALCLLASGCQSWMPFQRHAAKPVPFALAETEPAGDDDKRPQPTINPTDFVFYDHEFEGDSAVLTPLGQKHLMQVGAYLDTVAYPIIVEQSVNGAGAKLDHLRRQTICSQLARMGQPSAENRVVVAPAIRSANTAEMGEAGFYSSKQRPEAGPVRR